MDYETAFAAINLGVLPAWLLLFFAPGSGVTQKLVHNGLYPSVYGALYAVLLARAMFFGVAAEDAGMSSAAEVAAFFSHPNGVLLGWAHYLVFDLFVGAWIARDGVRRAVARWKLVLCLFLTLMVGPVGLLLYMLVRKLSAEGDLMLEES